MRSLKVWSTVCTVHGTYCDLGCTTEGDPGENASPAKARSLHSGWSPVQMTISLSSLEIRMPFCFSTYAHGTTCSQGVGCKLLTDKWLSVCRWGHSAFGWLVLSGSPIFYPKTSSLFATPQWKGQPSRLLSRFPSSPDSLLFYTVHWFSLSNFMQGALPLQVVYAQPILILKPHTHALWDGRIPYSHCSAACYNMLFRIYSPWFPAQRVWFIP